MFMNLSSGCGSKSGTPELGRHIRHTVATITEVLEHGLVLESLVLEP
jgi:hypothetical protein